MPRCAWRGACRARSRRSTKRSTWRGQADVVVFVGGLTGDVEGEEMKVSYPGFAGGDRTDLRLPASQRKLLEALHATGKPVVLVLTDGLGARGRLGAGESAGDRGRVVSGPARRHCRRRRAVRRRESVRAPAGDVLQGERKAAAVRRLHHAGPHVSILRRRAAVSVRTRAVVHALRVLRRCDWIDRG